MKTKIDYFTQILHIGPWQLKLKRVGNLEELIDCISDEEFARDERLPYWAELWPSALGLSRFLIGHAELIRDQSVLELGVGLGLTSLVLQKLAPKNLLLTDYEQKALDLTRENFALNRMALPKLQLLDWRSPNLHNSFTRIVASDILYEERFFIPLVNLVQRFLTPGGKLIIAEPNRTVARGFFSRLQSQGYVWQTTTLQIPEKPKPIRVTNYVIQKER